MNPPRDIHNHEANLATYGPAGAHRSVDYAEFVLRSSKPANRERAQAQLDMALAHLATWCENRGDNR